MTVYEMSDRITVLVTGANGFIGTILCKELINADFAVKGVVREPFFYAQIPQVTVSDINDLTQWEQALTGIDVVVHLAARVHVMDETSSNPQDLFRDINFQGTKNLALQAVTAGVKRFIYISTIKVNGESSDSVMSTDAVAAPKDAYAASKWEAEQVLQVIAAQTGLQVVIIRPPLVYGPGVKGNFLRLLKWVYRGFPVPLGAVENKRSMVYVDNLCDLIKICIHHPQAPGQVLFVSDNNDLTTPELIRLMASSLNHTPRLVTFPVSWLLGLAGLVGKGAEMERLCGSLQVDVQKTMKQLDWQPPYTVEQGVKKTVNWFLQGKQKR